MIDIQQQALKTYEENLTYLEKNHLELHKKLMTLDSAINSGMYEEKYALEYKNEGYFDVQNQITKEWLYGENSIEYSQKLIYMIDFQKTEGTFFGLKQSFISDNDAIILDQTMLDFHNSGWAMAKIINYHNKRVNAQDHLKFIFKFLFLDIGLGLHIIPTIQKTNAKIIFIQEDDLELFRLSLFVTNYKTISEAAQLFFAVSLEQEELKIPFLNFLNEGFNYNYYIKYLPFYTNYLSKLKQLQSFVYQQSHLAYPYNAILLRDITAPKYIYENYNFINLAKRRDLSPFNSTPIIIVASGPSTSKEVDWLKANKDLFIIISPLSTCRTLHAHGITPDMVTHIDPQAAGTAMLFDGLSESYFDKTVAVFSNNVDEATVTKFKKEQIYFIEQGTHFKAGFEGLSAPSVGEYLYALMMLFGTKKLYLLGLDLALEDETFSTHGNMHPFAKQIQDVDLGTCTANTHKHSIIFVPGNFKQKVPTLSGYSLSISQFNYFAANLQAKDQEVYNLSHGAKLMGAKPLKAQEVDLSSFNMLKKSQVLQEITSSLHTISQKSATKEDREILQKEIKGVKKLIKEADAYKNRKITPANYINDLSSLHDKLTGVGAKHPLDVYEVYIYFLKVAYVYMFDVLNTRELSDTTGVMKEIDELLVRQIKKIAEFYIQKLQEYMDKK